MHNAMRPELGLEGSSTATEQAADGETSTHIFIGNASDNHQSGSGGGPQGLLEDLAGVIGLQLPPLSTEDHDDRSEQPELVIFPDIGTTQASNVGSGSCTGRTPPPSLDEFHACLEGGIFADQALITPADEQAHQHEEAAATAEYVGGMEQMAPAFFQSPVMHPGFHPSMHRSLSIGHLNLPPFGTTLSGMESQHLIDNLLPTSLIRRVYSTGDILQPNVAGSNSNTSTPSNNNSNAASGGDDPTMKVGRYTPEERKVRIDRYRQKRTERNFIKKIKYACRKTLADSRPRIRGRFAKNQDAGVPPIKRKIDDDDDDDCVEEDEDYFVVDKDACSTTTSSQCVLTMSRGSPTFNDDQMVNEEVAPKEEDFFQLGFNNM